MPPTNAKGGVSGPSMVSQGPRNCADHHLERGQEPRRDRDARRLLGHPESSKLRSRAGAAVPRARLPSSVPVFLLELFGSSARPLPEGGRSAVRDGRSVLRATGCGPGRGSHGILPYRPVGAALGYPRKCHDSDRQATTSQNWFSLHRNQRHRNPRLRSCSNRWRNFSSRLCRETGRSPPCRPTSWQVRRCSVLASSTSQTADKERPRNDDEIPAPTSLPLGSVGRAVADTPDATMERKMKRLFIFALLCAPLWAQTSLRVTSGTVTVTIPGSAPYSTLGAVSQPLRWEMRLHDFGTQLPDPSVVASSYVFSGHTPVNAYYLFISALSHVPDSIIDNYLAINNCCAGHSDVLLRFQRDVVGNQVTAEVCDAETGSNCLSATQAITAHNTNSLAGLSISVYPGQSIAFLRWFSTVVPVGTPIHASGVTGDIGDWEFENSLADSSTKHLDITPHGATYAYVATPSYPPVCNAGASQSVRLGGAVSLDGTGSMTFGSPLTYAWTQTSGPTVTLTGATTATPGIAAISAGSYTFSLSVTDRAGPYTTTCSTELGAVVTGDDNIVITGNSVADELLGPMMRYGVNPWPWFDVAEKNDADLIVASLGTSVNPSRNYADFWTATKGPGTITVTTGSTTVTGSGTKFTTTFCQAPAYPGVPTAANFYPANIALAIDATNSLLVSSPAYTFVSWNVHNWVYIGSGTGWTVGWYLIQSVADGAALLDRSPSAAGNTNTAIFSVNGLGTKPLVWYPDSSREGYGLRGMPVLSCQSDTQLTLASPWLGDVADCHNGGCSYSYDDGGLDATGGMIWTYPGGEGSDYYDDVAGLYALYYRSGVGDYLRAARALADRFWKYRLGSGTECDANPGPNLCFSGGNEPRTQSLLGMVLRATDGRTDMWPGLELMLANYMWQMLNEDLLVDWGLWDIREEAYHMAMGSYGAR